METVRLGSYENKTVIINQRLVLDAICGEKPEAQFVLLLAMLIEYGHFLNVVLNEKAKKPTANLNGEAGKAFMSGFMECSDERLLKEDFKFADFISYASLASLNSKEREQKFPVEVSGLGYEQRQGFFCLLRTTDVQGKEV
jgi:hypothetical protein